LNTSYTANGQTYSTQTPVSGTSYILGSLTNGITYSFYLTALNSLGIPVGNSNQISVVPVDTSNLPLAPTNLAASSPAKRQIQITWTAPSDATGSTTYKIYRNTGTSGPPWTYIDTTSNTSYLNMGMGSGVTYYYVVTAVEAGVESPYSNVAYATAK
jgi:fibronectin type 3 domain-containing protein